MLVASGIYEVKNTKPLGSLADILTAVKTGVQKVNEFKEQNPDIVKLFNKENAKAFADFATKVKSGMGQKGGQSASVRQNTSVNFYPNVGGATLGRTKATRKGGSEKMLFTAINKLGYDPRQNARGRGRGLQGLNATTTPTTTTGSILDLFLPKDAQGLPIATIEHTLDSKTIFGLSAGIAGAMVVANLINKLSK